MNPLRETVKQLWRAYGRLGYPLRPLTQLAEGPLRWYYRQSPLLRHDSRFYWKPYLLPLLHRALVVEHPQDFRVYQDQIKFRSQGSAVSVHGYYVGEFEYHLTQFFVQQLRPGLVMFDVGAHHGYHTLVVAYELKRRGWEGLIYSFEPDPENFKLLEYNVRQNGLEQYVRCYCKAVSDVEAEQNLLSSSKENSDNVLETTRPPTFARTDTVSKRVLVTTLDSFLLEVERVDLIKIDVQGGEPQVLAGAKAMIDRFHPVLIVEAVQDWPSTAQTKIFLGGHDYRIQAVTASGQLCDLESPAVYVSWDWVGIPQR
ncbi:FkbM family methyltransferase [Candidatus Cyanaurora vandensis]|uniref:FkbM family methyltransferase n=1 Tax=Candidatus Cyanaurora vandensis TaxID=2714958 RepID=UPI00257D0FD8|nr:FkbM family methyltransferase [Candidatus Cyanaurora vandensis]